VAEAGCNVPVYIPDVISVLIFPDFTERHASPLKNAVVLSRKDLVGQSPAFDLNFSDFFNNSAVFHCIGMRQVLLYDYFSDIPYTLSEKKGKCMVPM